jgi:hypothetical protein
VSCARTSISDRVSSQLSARSPRLCRPRDRTWHTDGRGTEQLSHTFALIDILPWGRQEEWQDSPDGWPKSPTYSKWLDSPDVARLYGPDGDAQ